MPGSHRSDNPVLYHTILKDELVKRYGKDYLFRNQLFLPLGLTFSHFMAEDAENIRWNCITVIPS